MLRYGSRQICIKSENSHNSDAQKRLQAKIGHSIKYNNVDSLLALGVDKIGHVTCYECKLKMGLRDAI